LDEGRIIACFDPVSPDDLVRQNRYERDRSTPIPRDPMQAFEATYGERRAWPMSIFLVCIFPPALVYVSIRFAVFGVLRLFSVPKRLTNLA
jgi:hypothetical protein